eukprot:scaffold1391_cov84-Skeletonema_dohrnii-CCMP3373.AAC.1
MIVEKDIYHYSSFLHVYWRRCNVVGDLMRSKLGWLLVLLSTISYLTLLLWQSTAFKGSLQLTMIVEKDIYHYSSFVHVYWRRCNVVGDLMRSNEGWQPELISTISYLTLLLWHPQLLGVHYSWA